MHQVGNSFVTTLLPISLSSLIQFKVHEDVPQLPGSRREVQIDFLAVKTEELERNRETETQNLFSEVEESIQLLKGRGGGLNKHA